MMRLSMGSPSPSATIEEKRPGPGGTALPKGAGVSLQNLSRSVFEQVFPHTPNQLPVRVFTPCPPFLLPAPALAPLFPRPRRCASRSRFARSALVVSQNRSFLATKPRSGTMLPVRSSTDDQRPGVSLSEEAPALQKQTKSAALRARTRFRGHFQADFAHAYTDPPDARNSLGPPDQPASPDPLDPSASSSPPIPPSRTARPTPRASSLAKSPLWGERRIRVAAIVLHPHSG